MVRSLQTDSIIVSHLMKIVVLITILFIILAVSLKFEYRENIIFKTVSVVAKITFSVMENEILTEN